MSWYSTLTLMSCLFTLDSSVRAKPHGSYSVSVRSISVNELQLFQTWTASISELDDVLCKTVKIQPGSYLVYQISKNVHLQPGIHQSVYVGQHRCIFIITELLLDAVPDVLPQVAVVLKKIIVNTDAVTTAYFAATDNQKRDVKLQVEAATAVRSKPGYEISFSLLNPDPSRFRVSWDIRTATSEHLHLLLDRLAVIGNFTVASQILRYVSLGVNPKLDSKENLYYLTQHDLPHIINPVESRLGTYVSSNPTLDFLVYVPTQHQSPLHIVDDMGHRVTSNAFLSPRWGGIIIHNVNESGDCVIEMEKIMPVFVSQLRQLLGVPDLRSPFPEILMSNPPSSGISDWELDGLLLHRCMENIAMTTTTLTSLIQLLEEVTNMVISDHIQAQIVKAIESVAECQNHLKSGRLMDAFLLSKQAIESSEAAFFDPSMLTLLYFPEDQKFAIYVPLFVPVSLPLLLSTRSALKQLFKRKERAVEDTDGIGNIQLAEST
ncbi:GPI transamidase component PIG-S-like [Corticium candelabrum]|uniref:GPI transamidase component PIG-S-like n=1 Tax=Corticium candelabrum TaxID=121492 RepID=UPI002E253D7A|nr:GPI transamidase component PIG-S-like [Corticium candelabrum]